MKFHAWGPCAAHTNNKFDSSYWHRKAGEAKRRRTIHAPSKFLRNEKRIAAARALHSPSQPMSGFVFKRQKSESIRFCFPLDLSIEAKAQKTGSTRRKQMHLCGCRCTSNECMPITMHHLNFVSISFHNEWGHKSSHAIQRFRCTRTHAHRPNRPKKKPNGNCGWCIRSWHSRYHPGSRRRQRKKKKMKMHNNNNNNRETNKKCIIFFGIASAARRFYWEQMRCKPFTHFLFL